MESVSNGQMAIGASDDSERGLSESGKKPQKTTDDWVDVSFDLTAFQEEYGSLTQKALDAQKSVAI
jgi:hypothetical protein